MVYSEQLNMFSGVCKRTISITVFEELQQAGVFVYDTNKKQIYDVHIFYGEVFNKQKLPAYLNKIVESVINLFMWGRQGKMTNMEKLLVLLCMSMLILFSTWDILTLYDAVCWQLLTELSVFAVSVVMCYLTIADKI